MSPRFPGPVRRKDVISVTRRRQGFELLQAFHRLHRLYPSRTACAQALHPPLRRARRSKNACAAASLRRLRQLTDRAQHRRLAVMNITGTSRCVAVSRAFVLKPESPPCGCRGSRSRGAASAATRETPCRTRTRRLGPTGTHQLGNFVARPFASPVIDGGRPIVHATFYASGALRMILAGLRFDFQ